MLDNAIRKKMEDLFFLEQDRRLIAQRQKIQQLKETKENLAKVSGITNEAVLEKLVALDIRPETLATLFAIPLIEVAWADGELQDGEREQLFQYAEKSGMRKKGLDPKIMSEWLKRKPDPALLEAWVHYMQALSRELGAAERQALKEEVMGDARTIAQAAGGILGFGKISAEEQKMIDRLAAAFG
jgi:hypothetical protein